LEDFFKKNPKLIVVSAYLFNHLIGRNHLRFHGKNNKIEFSHSFIKSTKINIQGNNNCILLGNSVYIENGDFWIEDNGGCISIGDKTLIAGHTHLACIEGKSITIGSDCLFSTDVVFRVGDSHSIIDMEGKRINPSQNICVGNHVWFGNKTILAKGASIADDSIVGTGAIVTKKFTQPNIVIAGVPARIVKENVNWDKNRI